MTTLFNAFHFFAILLALHSFGSKVVTVDGITVSSSDIRYFFYQSAEYPRDCREALQTCAYNKSSSGVYLIKPDQVPDPFQVYCENDVLGDGWTVIHRRLHGSINFNRTWHDYKHGFGFIGSEFWIGNERLAYLTNQNRYSLLINLEDTSGQTHYLTYNNFRITDEWDNYSLFNLNLKEAKTNATYVGCYIQERDVVLREGDSYINPTCSSRITCGNNALTRQDYSCGAHATCQDQNGIGQCHCNQWYVGDGITCTLHPCYVEEKRSTLREGESYINSGCSSTTACRNNKLDIQTYTCSDHASCENRNGVGRCVCNQWYVGDGEICTLHPCYVEEKRRTLSEGESYINSGCSSTTTCRNNRLDIQTYTCSDHASCKNRNGVGRCVCNQWYVGDGEICTLHPCYVEEKRRTLSNGESYINSVCSSTITCRNERLRIRSYSCSSDARCENRNGVGLCICNQGFEGDGVTCTPLPCYLREINRILSEGEFYVNARCSRKAVCINGNINWDNEYSCSPHAICDVRNNVRQCYCNAGYNGDGQTCNDPPKDCQDIYDDGVRNSGVYTVKPTGWTGSAFEVYCNMTHGGGWTVFQRRQDGSVDFYLDWNSYKTGFGDLNTEFWLGNDKLFYLTKQKRYKLRVDVVSREFVAYHGQFDFFRINAETDNYRLSGLGTYTGPIDERSNPDGRFLRYHWNYEFSTKDRDNDAWPDNCAVRNHGAWWYKSCSNSNFNGDYHASLDSSESIGCADIPGPNYNLVYTEMKIRPA